MQVKNYEKIEEKIKREIDWNTQKINEFTYKIHLIERYSRKDYAILLGLISFIFLTCVGGIFFKSYVIPFNFLSYVYMGISAVVGIIGQNLYDRKYKFKEKLREFSSSKTSKERIHEKTKYQMELEKVKIRNQVLKEVSKKITEDKVLLEHISMIYNVEEKKRDSRSTEEIREDIFKKKEVLKEDGQKLELLSMKLFLRKTFYKVGNRFERILDFIGDVLPASCMFGMVMNLPNLVIHPVYFSSFMCILDVLMPFVIGGIGSIGYQWKIARDENKVFHL